MASPMREGGRHLHSPLHQVSHHQHGQPDEGKCSVCDPFAHAPIKELTREMYDVPQKYTSSQHGNKCLEEEIRSVTKVGFVNKDKASFVRKDTTGT